MSPRYDILSTYGAWTALSALRSGSPVKDGAQIYPALKRVPFVELFDPLGGNVEAAEFDVWHRKAVASLSSDLELCVGWAAKIVNVYLKTTAYIGDLGRPGLRALLHPPIDGGLWEGIKKEFAKEPQITRQARHKTKIKDILDYDADYLVIIGGLRLAAQHVGCDLIEVEQFWQLPNASAEADPAVLRLDLIPLKGHRVVLWDAYLHSEIVGEVQRQTERVASVWIGDGKIVEIKNDGSTNVGRWKIRRLLETP